jgi:hypothetical protein
MPPRLLPIRNGPPWRAFTRCRYSWPRHRTRTTSSTAGSRSPNGASVTRSPSLTLPVIECPRGRTTTCSPFVNRRWPRSPNPFLRWAGCATGRDRVEVAAPGRPLHLPVVAILALEADLAGGVRERHRCHSRGVPVAAQNSSTKWALPADRLADSDSGALPPTRACLAASRP